MVLLQVLFEIFGQVFLELLLELGVEFFELRMLPGGRERDATRASLHWLLRLGAYTTLGAAIGGLSLLALPGHIIHSSAWRIANLFLGPAFLGLLMMVRGRRFDARDTRRAGINSFWPAFLFAFALNAVRFYFGR